MQNTRGRFADKKTIILCMTIISAGVLSTGITPAYSSNGAIPDWIKNIAGFWSQGQITDSEFIGAIKFLIESEILVIDDEETDHKTSERGYPPPIPEYTDEEMSALYERKFLETVNSTSLLLEGDDLHIDLKRAGLFTYSKLGDEVTDYRIDVVVTNIGNEPVHFSIFGSFIQTVDRKQYESSHIGTLESGKILPGSIIEGSILFEVDDNIKEIKSIILDDDYIFDLTNNRAYTEQQLREETYEKNAITASQIRNKIKYTEDFDITLYKAGSYNNDGTNGFRADFTVKNIGNEPASIPSNIVLLDGRGNQYDRSYHSTLESGQIHPGIVEKGFVFFEDYVGDTPEITIRITKYCYPDDCTWEWVVDLVR